MEHCIIRWTKCAFSESVLMDTWLSSKKFHNAEFGKWGEFSYFPLGNSSEIQSLKAKWSAPKSRNAKDPYTTFTLSFVCLHLHARSPFFHRTPAQIVIRLCWSDHAHRADKFWVTLSKLGNSKFWVTLQSYADCSQNHSLHTLHICKFSMTLNWTLLSYTIYHISYNFQRCKGQYTFSRAVVGLGHGATPHWAVEWILNGGFQCREARWVGFGIGVVVEDGVVESSAEVAGLNSALNFALNWQP